MTAMKKDRNGVNIISGDEYMSLGIGSKIIWIALNLFQNYFLTSPRKLLFKCSDFFPNDDYVADELSADCSVSPSRFLSNIFWRQLDWRLIKDTMGEINVLDVGSGKGDYGLKLDQLSGGLSSYMGLDIESHDDWALLKSKKNNFDFVLANSENISDHIDKKVNFIVSQSSVEHFKNDLTFFSQLKKHTDSKDKMVLQVHMLPTKYCLRSYLWHGYRQYTLRMINNIAKIFENSENVDIRLYNLGGKALNDLHWQWITRPRLLRRADRRKIDPIGYMNLLKKMSLETYKRGYFSRPSFYALVIITNSTLSKDIDVVGPNAHA